MSEMYLINAITIICTIVIAYCFHARATKDSVRATKDSVQQTEKLHALISHMFRYLECIKEGEEGVTLLWNDKDGNPRNIPAIWKTLSGSIHVHTHASANIVAIRRCKNCGREFEMGSTNNDDFCSDDCNSKYHKK